ncbi:type IV pilin N-terminal domain-containing protein [Methanolobus sp.]|uniref:type IV pilin N-terminal domain-containing protein n=1 Tax=Methanolobus sp. TaxID=1874737 RepID=UPI0025CB7DC3|nr:type IV pilin N-terminal domain-containing protein [Methanolobus sp.]
MSSQKSPFLENTDAISEIIGEVLLTAIAVLSFSILAVFIFSYADQQDHVYADIQGWVDVNSDTIYLRHAGGETIDIPKTRVILDINGTRRELSSSELEQIKGNTAWNLGETIRINASKLWSDNISQDDYVAIVMVNIDSNLVIKSGSLLGDVRDVTASSNGSTPTPTLIAPVLSGQNPLTTYQSNKSQSITFSATSSQSSINEFLLNGQHLVWSNGTSPSYTNTSAFEGTYTITLVAKNTTNPLLTDSLAWTWTVVSGTSAPTAPVLSGQNPVTPYESTTSQSVTFSATSNQSSINEFLLNGQHLSWSNGTSPSYTNTSASEGTYTVTLIAKNTTDSLFTDSLAWTWTVVAETPTPVSGVNMNLQKNNKGGYIADGDYIKFRTGGSGSSITIDGTTTGIGNNRNVMFVMNGQQTSGESDIGISGSSRRITTYDFNIEFYMNGVLINTGDVTSVYISKADNFESTLLYYLPSDLSTTYLSENGGSNVIIDWYPNNGSEIQLYNITPSDGVNFRMEFDSAHTYIAGFDSNYTMG